MPEVLRRWIRDERGQDLIEYALLSSFIGFSCVAAINILSGTMNAVYTTRVGDRPPARSTFQVAKLPSGALVEIEAVAHL